jgi:hypothetical protein
VQLRGDSLFGHVFRFGRSGVPVIHFTIGEFDKIARAYPVFISLPGTTRTRWLTREEARALWQQNPYAPLPLSPLLFQALLQGYESDWSSAYSLLSQNLAPLPTGEPSSIKIYLAIQDRELNELPWELAAPVFGPNCQLIRYSEVPVALSGPLQLPLEAIVIEGRAMLGSSFSDAAFSLDQTLRNVFGPHADISSVFRATQVAGANDRDVSGLVAGRRFDIVQLSASAQWQTISSDVGSEGVLRVGNGAPSLNAASVASLLSAAATRFLILVANIESQPPMFDLAFRLRAFAGPVVLIVPSDSNAAPGVLNGYLSSIYDAIVHDLPLDAAAFRAGLASPRLFPSLFLFSGGEELLRVSPLASTLLQRLDQERERLLSFQARVQTAPPPAGQATAMFQNITQGFAKLDEAHRVVTGISTWTHESGGILPLREAIAGVERAAEVYASAVDTYEKSERAAQRVVNTHFESDGKPVENSHSLVAGRKYTFLVDVGAPSLVSNLVDAKPIPEWYLEPFYEEGGVDLRICLFSEQFRLDNDSQLLRLPRFGPSEPVAFEVQAPFKPGSARLRAGLYHRQNLLQSILVTAQITSAPEANLEKGNYAEIEFSLADRLQAREDLPKRALNVLVNQTPEGTHTFAILGENIKKQFSIFGGDEVKLARQALLSICSTTDKRGNLEYSYRDDDNSGDEAKLVADLKRLAYWGWKLYCRLIMEPPNDEFESRLETVLKQPSNIQVASTTSARYVYPWSIVYDKPLVSSPKNNICPEALNILRNGGPAGYLENISCPGNGCPSAEDRNAICPFRFWGFKHSIEQPPNWGEILTEISIAGDPKCCIGAHSALSGSQHRKEIERCCNILADYQESKDDIAVSLASAAPHLVYFYCHGGRTLSAPWLGVGNDEHIESSDFKAWNVRWPQTRPLVFINGCHTVDLSPDDLLDFVTVFRWTRASGVIGTEIAIPVSLAREFGREFLQRFLSGPYTVNQVMRWLRLRLLEKYNLLGLAYTPYCYGELHVTRAPH